ncbi:MAG: DUF1416 domain-containing protein [Actinomycetota bacterium]|nr:DUF1416 domain-containing protein [Actinomycetota bacterium]
MSCGGAAGAARATNVDPATQAIIQGTVVKDGQPVPRAYVRLLDRTGEFTAEVPTGESGEFRFFAAVGEWTVRVLAPQSSPVESTVSASRGEVADVELTL